MDTFPHGITGFDRMIRGHLDRSRGYETYPTWLTFSFRRGGVVQHEFK